MLRASLQIFRGPGGGWHARMQPISCSTRSGGLGLGAGVRDHAAADRSRVNILHMRNSLVNGNESIDLNNFQERTLTWYSCGPTVYDDSHLGHARTYICTDIIRRILQHFFKLDVHYAMGVTDVDDKIIQRAREDGCIGGVSPADVVRVARTHEESFMADMDALNVLRPDSILRVTEHMDDIVLYVEKLVRDGKAYESADGVYFDTAQLGDTYGKFGVKAGGPGTADDFDLNVDVDHEEPFSGKRHWRDFALWKKAKDGEPSWGSPWGPGRPGWHIECSAMTHATFGSSLDVHSGGIDLKFPHHTNEIAQCEAHGCCDDDWVKHWIHTGHLYIKGSKMSKSLKNFVSIQEFLRGNLSPRPAVDLRLFFLSHKYHSSLHFSPDRVHEAGALREKLCTFLHSVESLMSSWGAKSTHHRRRPCEASRALSDALSGTRRDVAMALRNDFDTPEALHLVSKLVTEASKYMANFHQDLSMKLALEPLVASATFVGDFFTMLGVELVPHAARTGQDAGMDVNKYVNCFVDFRGDVRRKILMAQNSLKVVRVSGKATVEDLAEVQGALDELMQCCDRAREEIGRDVMNVRIVDSSDESTWSKIN